MGVRGCVLLSWDVACSPEGPRAGVDGGSAAVEKGLQGRLVGAWGWRGSAEGDRAGGGTWVWGREGSAAGMSFAAQLAERRWAQRGISCLLSCPLEDQGAGV